MILGNPIYFGSAFLVLVACAHATPVELVNARNAYDQATRGPAPKYTPAELHIAQESLSRAEAAFKLAHRDGYAKLLGVPDRLGRDRRGHDLRPAGRGGGRGRAGRMERSRPRAGVERRADPGRV